MYGKIQDFWKGRVASASWYVPKQHSKFRCIRNCRMFVTNIYHNNMWISIEWGYLESASKMFAISHCSLVHVSASNCGMDNGHTIDCMAVTMRPPTHTVAIICIHYKTFLWGVQDSSLTISPKKYSEVCDNFSEYIDMCSTAITEWTNSFALLNYVKTQCYVLTLASDMTRMWEDMYIQLTPHHSPPPNHPFLCT